MHDDVKVCVYYDEKGFSAFEDWLLALKDKKIKASILHRIGRMARRNFGDFKNLKEGLYELRFEIMGGVRVYFTQDGANVVILLCAGNKRRQDNDIKKARAYIDAYREGQGYANPAKF